MTDRLQLTLLGGPAAYVRARSTATGKSAAAVVGRGLALLELLESTTPGETMIIDDGDVVYEIECRHNRAVRRLP
jgi:hypothetical protein